MGRRSRPPVRDEERLGDGGPRFGTSTAVDPRRPNPSGPLPPSPTLTKDGGDDGDAEKAEVVERVYVGGMDPSRGITVSLVAERLRAVDGVRILSVEEIRGGGGAGDGDDDEGTFFFANVRLVDDGRNDSSSHSGETKADEESREAAGKAKMSARDVLAARYHNVKWRGCRLRIEPARMTFLDRLAVEIEERKRKRVDERKMVDEVAPQPSGRTATKAVRRHLRIRRRYGEEAFHVDTKPRRMVVTAPSGGGDDADAALLGAMGRRRRKLERLRMASTASSDGAKGKTSGGGVRGRGGVSGVRAMHIIFCDDNEEAKRTDKDKRDAKGRSPDDDVADGDAASYVESFSSSGEESEEGGEAIPDDDSTDESSESTSDGGDSASRSDDGECHHSGEEGSVHVTPRPPQQSKYVWSDDDEEDAAKSTSSSTSSPSSFPETNTPKDRNDTEMSVEVRRYDPPPSSSSPSSPPEEPQPHELVSDFDRGDLSEPQHISTDPIDSLPPAQLDGDGCNSNGVDGGAKDGNLAQGDGSSDLSRSSSSSSSTDTDAAARDGPIHDKAIPPGMAGGYVWSDDDDDDEGGGFDGGDVRAEPPPGNGIDEEGIDDADHPEEEELGRDWDIDRDVSRNLDVLAGLFPDMAKKVEAARRDLRQKRWREERGSEAVGLEGNGVDLGASLAESSTRGMKEPHDENSAAADPSVLMRRYDPANVRSARMYEVVGGGEATATTTEAPVVAEENPRKDTLGAHESDSSKSKGGGIDSSETDTSGSDRRQHSDVSSDNTSSEEISEKAGAAADVSAELNRTDLGGMSGSGTERPMARIYEQDRLERIFAQSRSKEEEGRHRHIVKDELEEPSSSPFTFGFADLSPPASPTTTGAFSRDSDRDGNRRSGMERSEDAGMTDGGESGGVFSFEFRIKGDEKHDEEMNATRGGNDSRTTHVESALDGKTSGAKEKLMEDDTSSSSSVAIEKKRRRGLFFPDNEVLHDMEAAFFDMNGGFERIASGGETAAAEMEAWLRERRALTLDWKRKQKRALAAPRRSRQRGF